MPFMLMDLLSDLAGELKTLLIQEKELALAEQVSKLQIVDRCRCGDDFCATFYTKPRPKKSYGTGHRSIMLEPKDGILILDVENNNISCIEVLYRDEIRKMLHSFLP